jgi:hypothetical protein
MKDKQASKILDTTKESLKSLTELVGKFSSHINLSSDEIADSLSEVSPLIRQFCESFRSFQGLIHPASEEAMLYSEWLNDIAFQHDTTFPSPHDFISFCNSNNFSITDIVCAILYLKSNSYRDLWSRFSEWNLSVTTIGRRTKKGITGLAELAKSMLAHNRTLEVWKSSTPDYWHFSNLPYTVDATYLYTYAGSNALLLVCSLFYKKIFFFCLSYCTFFLILHPNI